MFQHSPGLLALALLTALPIAAGEHAAKRKARFTVDSATAGGFTADTTCTRGSGRVPALLLSWRPDTTLDNQRLEISAHSGGFDKGLFAILDPVKNNVRTRRAGPEVPVDFFQSVLQLVAGSVTVDRRGGVRLELDGLQPNLYYFVRVASKSARGWMVSPTLRQLAPPCLTDGSEPRRPR